MIVPPDSSFHDQTRFRNSARPSSRRDGLLVGGKLALDDHLRRDAGVVGSRLPQHVAAAHALEAHENILQRIVERVPHMERARHVRWRDYDRIGAFLPPDAARPALKALAFSHSELMRGSISAGWNVFSSIGGGVASISTGVVRPRS